MIIFLFIYNTVDCSSKFGFRGGGICHYKIKVVLYLFISLTHSRIFHSTDGWEQATQEFSLFFKVQRFVASDDASKKRTKQRCSSGIIFFFFLVLTDRWIVVILYRE